MCCCVGVSMCCVVGVLCKGHTCPTRIDFGLLGLPDYPCHTYYYNARDPPGSPVFLSSPCFLDIPRGPMAPSRGSRAAIHSPSLPVLALFPLAPPPALLSTRLLNVMYLLHMPVRVIYSQFVLP